MKKYTPRKKNISTPSLPYRGKKVGMKQLYPTQHVERKEVPKTDNLTSLCTYKKKKAVKHVRLNIAVASNWYKNCICCASNFVYDRCFHEVCESVRARLIKERLFVPY